MATLAIVASGDTPLDEIAEIIASHDGPTLIAPADLLALHALLQLAETATTTQLLTDSRDETAGEPLGVIAVADSDRQAYAACLRELATSAGDGSVDVPALCVEGLVRSGVIVRTTPLDVESIRLRSAVKREDGFFTTYFVSPYSKYIARWCARHGITPNPVTVFSICLGLAAAAAFARGERAWLIAGAILLQVAFTFDCVDGQIARYTRNFSQFGGWFDAMGDRTKEYIVYAGLAYGANRAGLDHAWALAIAAMALQTVRHMADFSFAQKYLPLVPLDAGADQLGVGARAANPAVLARLIKVKPVRWMHKIVSFPIGERFAAISLTSAVTDGRVVFIVLLALGGLALTYSTGHRVLRALL